MLHELNAAEVKALRTCNDVVLRYKLETGASQIEAILRSSDTNPWEQRRDIPVRFEFTDYGAENSWDMELVEFFTVCGIYRSMPEHDTIGSILSLLRVGDALNFHVYKDNSNGTVRDAGCYCDFVNVNIYRAGKVLATFRWYTEVGTTASYRAIRARQRVRATAEPQA